MRDGKIVALELYKTDYNESGEAVIDEDQFIRIKCDYVISAFGSGIQSSKLVESLKPLAMKSGKADIDLETMTAKSANWLFSEEILLEME